MRLDELLERLRIAALRAPCELTLVPWPALHYCNYTASASDVPASTRKLGTSMGRQA